MRMWTVHILKLKIGYDEEDLGCVDVLWRIMYVMWRNVAKMSINVDVMWRNVDVMWSNVDVISQGPLSSHFKNENVDVLWRNVDVIWNNVDVMWTLHISKLKMWIFCGGMRM